jgi:glutathione synthase
MRAGFVVNVTGQNDASLTTYRLAASLCNAGHEVWVMSPGKFALDADGRIRNDARSVSARQFSSTKSFLAALNGPNRLERAIEIESLDLLWLRSNPFALKGWAQEASQDFARLAAQRGVTVVNDPIGLAHASSKLYVESFPEEIRPRTLITRSLAGIERFLADEGTIVLKPVRGFGGRGVFKVSPENRANLEQIVRSICRDGYVVAQEYLPGTEQGDTRLFLMNGLPLEHKGVHAIAQRVRTGEDLRNNVHAGGEVRQVYMNDALARVAEMVRPRLVADGMFFVGLDVVGDKLLEVNVFSPGGLADVQRLTKVDFTRAITVELERKMRLIGEAGGDLTNCERAML